MHLFRIPEYVHACCTDDGVVFLDTRNDRYFALGGRRIAGLAAIVQNWPTKHESNINRESMSVSGLERVTHALLECKLLIPGATAEISRDRVDVPPLAMTAPQHTTSRCRSGNALDIINFLTACAKAAWNLRWRSLESIALEVTAVRARNYTAKAGATRSAVELGRLFCSLRRFCFSEKNRCLFSALSLVYFLRRYGCFPLWVIGVRTTPFTAHSWVQDGQIALDGDPAVICHYVPILVA